MFAAREKFLSWLSTFSLSISELSIVSSLRYDFINKFCFRLKRIRERDLVGNLSDNNTHMYMLNMNHLNCKK